MAGLIDFEAGRIVRAVALQDPERAAHQTDDAALIGTEDLARAVGHRRRVERRLHPRDLNAIGVDQLDAGRGVLARRTGLAGGADSARGASGASGASGTLLAILAVEALHRALAEIRDGDRAVGDITRADRTVLDVGRLHCPFLQLGGADRVGRQGDGGVARSPQSGEQGDGGDDGRGRWFLHVATVWPFARGPESV